MANKRDRWSSEKLEQAPRTKRKKTKDTHAPLQTSFKSFYPEPRLDCLPDTLTIEIMQLLDIVSLSRLAVTCKRFYHLSREENLWTDVDMTSLPSMDVRKVKKIIEQYLSPKLHTIQIQSNYNLRAKKPKIDVSVLDVLIDKCPKIKVIELRNCDLFDALKTKHNSTCPRKEVPLTGNLCQYCSVECVSKFGRCCPSLLSVSLVECKTPLGWLGTVNWPHLEHLSLADSVKTSHFEVQVILESDQWRKTLKSLDLTGCYRITTFNIKSTPLSLERLNLSGTNITDTSLESLTKCPSLKELYLRNCKHLTNKGLLAIPYHVSPNVKLIDVSGMTDINPSTFEQLVQTMPNSNIIF